MLAILRLNSCPGTCLQDEERTLPTADQPSPRVSGGCTALPVCQARVLLGPQAIGQALSLCQKCSADLRSLKARSLSKQAETPGAGRPSQGCLPMSVCVFKLCWVGSPHTRKRWVPCRYHVLTAWKQ